MEHNAYLQWLHNGRKDDPATVFRNYMLELVSKLEPDALYALARAMGIRARRSNVQYTLGVINMKHHDLPPYLALLMPGEFNLDYVKDLYEGMLRNWSEEDWNCDVAAAKAKLQEVGLLQALDDQFQAPSTPHGTTVSCENSGGFSGQLSGRLSRADSGADSGQASGVDQGNLSGDIAGAESGPGTGQDSGVVSESVSGRDSVPRSGPGSATYVGGTTTPLSSTRATPSSPSSVRPTFASSSAPSPGSLLEPESRTEFISDIGAYQGASRGTVQATQDDSGDVPFAGDHADPHVNTEVGASVGNENGSEVCHLDRPTTGDDGVPAVASAVVPHPDADHLIQSEKDSGTYREGLTHQEASGGFETEAGRGKDTLEGATALRASEGPYRGSGENPPQAPDWLQKEAASILNHWWNINLTAEKTKNWFASLGPEEREWLDEQTWLTKGSRDIQTLPKDRLFCAAADLTLRLMDAGLLDLSDAIRPSESQDTDPVDLPPVLRLAAIQPKRAGLGYADLHDRRTINMPVSLIRRINRATRRWGQKTTFAHLAIQTLAWVISPGAVPTPRSVERFPAERPDLPAITPPTRKRKR